VIEPGCSGPALPSGDSSAGGSRIFEPILPCGKPVRQRMRRLEHWPLAFHASGLYAATDRRARCPLPACGCWIRETGGRNHAGDGLTIRMAKVTARWALHREYYSAACTHGVPISDAIRRTVVAGHESCCRSPDRSSRCGRSPDRASCCARSPDRATDAGCNRSMGGSAMRAGTMVRPWAGAVRIAPGLVSYAWRA